MADMCSREAFIIGRVRVIRVQDQAAAFRLVDEDLPLGINIVLEVLMLVGMMFSVLKISGRRQRNGMTRR